MTKTAEAIEEKETKNIHKKILEVMKATGIVEKKGHNAFQNYDYATEPDIIAELRDKLIEQGLVIIPSVTDTTHERYEVEGKDGSRRNETLTSVTILYTIFDSESDERLEIYAIGQGTDGGDKGVYKAITGANKYFLMKTFMLPTGDDPEKDSNDKSALDTKTPAIKNGNMEAVVCKSCGSDRVIMGTTKPDNVRNPNRPYWRCLSCPPAKSFSHWVKDSDKALIEEATDLSQLPF